MGKQDALLGHFKIKNLPKSSLIGKYQYVYVRRMTMPRWTAKDTAKETDSPTKDTNRAFHDARDSAASSGYLDERNESKVSDSEEGKSIWGAITSLFGKKND